MTNQDRPSALLLSRQNLPYAPKSGLDDIAKGAYVLAEPSEVGLNKAAQAVIIATGSEVQLALHAQAELAKLRGSDEQLARDVERLDALIGQMLRLASINDPALTLRSVRVNVTDLLRRIAQDCEIEAAAREVEIRVDGPDDLVVDGDPDLLRSAFENVLRNAASSSQSKALAENSKSKPPLPDVATSTSSSSPLLPFSSPVGLYLRSTFRSSPVARTAIKAGVAGVVPATTSGT